MQGKRRADLTPGKDELRVVVRPDNGLGLLVHFASPSPQVWVAIVVVGGGGGGEVVMVVVMCGTDGGSCRAR
jgi:hypothetical protein